MLSNMVKNSVTMLTSVMVKKFMACNKNLERIYQNHENKQQWLYHFCDSNLKQGKIPGLPKANGLSYPERPVELDLTQLEEN